jgi:HD superfamily phosphohydrolase
MEVWSRRLQSPCSPYSSRKIIHDPIWGTTRYEAWEVALLDSGLFQRLRGLKQTGFAYLTYPAAEHSRFQHTLGVMHAASKIFDSIIARKDEDGISWRGLKAGYKKARVFSDKASRYRILLRLAAMVHDVGHSFYSHTSERIFSLVDPFPSVTAALKVTDAKEPGAAEVVVYLLITSEQWQRRVSEIWAATKTAIKPPDPSEWERIGRWVMGQESDPELKFLADIVSGPLDADKLDYISRDAYAAGIPIGYDLERFTSTVCVDPQGERLRLTIPVKGINALEQLVMGRLVLNSYLYHHQKVRAAEAMFERALIRELLDRGTTLGVSPPWPLFDMEDADVHCACQRDESFSAYRQILGRRLPVRVAEFKEGELKEPDTEAVSSEYGNFVVMLRHQTRQKLESYKKLIEHEDSIADAAGLPAGSVLVDVAKPPGYKELDDLELPEEHSDNAADPRQVLNYGMWIEAFNTYRSYVRVFVQAEGDVAASDSVWDGISNWFAGAHMELPDRARRRVPKPHESAS